MISNFPISDMLYVCGKEKSAFVEREVGKGKRGNYKEMWMGGDKWAEWEGDKN